MSRPQRHEIYYMHACHYHVLVQPLEYNIALQYDNDIMMQYKYKIDV